MSQWQKKYNCFKLAIKAYIMAFYYIISLGFFIVDKVLSGDIKPIISAYLAKEIVDNLVSEGYKCGKDISLLQTAFWSLFREPYVKTTFTPSNFYDIVLREVKGRDETIALAKALRIEPKDAPVVALAHYHAVPLVTMDVKSLLNVKDRIYELIGVEIISVDEFLGFL